MEKINVLQINKLYYPVIGGIEKVTQQVAEGLSEKTNMRVLVCQQKGKTKKDLINNVKVLRSSSLGTFFSMPVSFSFFLNFKKLAKNKNILQIHLPFPLADIAVSLFGFKGKVILWWHSDIIRQKFFLAIYKPFMNKLLKRADCIIVATEGHIVNSDYLIPYKEKCKVIPYGVENTMAKPPILNKTKKVIYVLFVGRLVYYKGCDVLLEAFSKVTGAFLTIVGKGPLEKELQNKAKYLKIHNKVKFINNATDNELKNIFNNCDIFVLPSVKKSEAFGIVQIEAMSYGKPVINTELPSGVPYVSKHMVTGLTVTPGNPEELCLAIQKLVDNPELRYKLGREAYIQAKEKFSLNKMLDSTLNLYNQILENP